MKCLLLVESVTSIARLLLDISINKYHFEDSISVSSQDNIIYELHSFSGTSSCFFSSVVHLLRLVNGIVTASIVLAGVKWFRESEIVAYRT